MLTEHQIAASAAPITIDGTTYWLTPLNDLDFLELDRWVQAEYLAMARESCKDASEDDKRITMQAAMNQAFGLTWTSPQGAKIVATLPGFARIISQSLKKRHPEMSAERVHKILFNSANVERLREVFKAQNLDPFGRREQNPQSQQQSPQGNSRQRRKQRRKKRSI